ncbi:MAG: twitching motility protein PilJ [Arenicella sp.]|jgi:twitching motility protein PilJ
MSKPKQDYQDSAIESEGLEGLQNLYEDSGLKNLDQLDDFDLEEPAFTAAGTDTASGNEKLWLFLTLISFVLALLSVSLLGPAVSDQKQRADDSLDAISKVKLSSLAATQAMTEVGRFEPVGKAIENAQASIDRLANANSVSAKLANIIFANSSHDSEVAELWAGYKAASEQFLANKQDVTEVKEKLFALNGRLSRAVGDSVVFVEAVAKEGRNKASGAAKDKYLFLTSEASNLNGILSRLNGSNRNYFNNDSNLAQLADQQNGLMVRLQETLSRIVSNSAEIVGTAASPLRAQYADLEARVLEVGDRASAVSEARASLGQMSSQGIALSDRIQAASNQGGTLPLVSNLVTILPLILALLGALSLWRYSQAQTRELFQHDAGLEEALADQQESILKLLDEMSALADGDLTVEAEVTDQITGAIADSVNFAVIEMRELVSQINRASIEVANESEQAVSNAQSVSQSNITQSGQISEAAVLMQQVSNGMREMSEQASSSSVMATESLLAASQGAQAVRDTIEGMDDMREQIQDTSKRIKRLGESSQRIGDIVALIDDIAEQTNILSLNAAIQASMAGEAGRGFAVVADEVQSLAERSTEATKKIGELVTTIQNDTNDAVLSMEKATQQVVSGTKVADSAGKALAEIESVSKRLSGLVEGISKGSNEQAETVIKVSEKVALVSDSSTDTSRKAQESANSISKLLELAKDLETSVSRFKLPPS